MILNPIKIKAIASDAIEENEIDSLRNGKAPLVVFDMPNNDISIKFKDTTIITNEMKLIKLKEIRKRIAESHSLIPSGFINDRVILNIHEKKPKNIGELWAVDGISNEFIMMYGDEFMKEYNKITSTEKKITIMGKKITSIDKKNNINLSTVNTNLSTVQTI